jgi:hypothetical protein
VDEDWRLRITLEGSEHAEALHARLEAEELSDEVAGALGDGVAVSHDEAEIFVYAGTHEAVRAAEQVVRDDLARHGWQAEIAVSRWHDDAEDWEPADAPLATSAAEREAEHTRAMHGEDADAAARGYAEFEARAALPTHRAARELSERLTREGVEHARRWRYVFIAAADEDSARQWAERLRSEAPTGTEVTVEGTFEMVERNMPTPFKSFAALGGGLP